jgi:RsiW-degrading membrane proteinase PrsW (M82 family)
MKRKPYSNRGLEDGLIDDRGDFKIEEPDVRTHRQRAMAITTGMISVAVGLACAENMLYVFVLGGAMANDKGGDLKTGDVIEAWIILFVRSIFPIHALSAAMQSIGMIRKFVETTDHNGHRIGIGRIILPAVILHGSFDAVLLGITVYSETAWDMYLEANNGRVPEDGTPYNPVILNLVAAMSVVAIMVIGIVWYFRENRLQSKRLKELEEMEKAKWLSSSPLGDEADPRPGDMELV